MPLETSFIQFPKAQTEFQNLGISSVQLETATGNQILPIDEFCAQLPTASAFAKEYGVLKTTNLLAQQLEQRQPELNRSGDWQIIKRLSKLNCFLDALNYTIGSEGIYTEPLPYSVSLSLAAQLTYGVAKQFILPSFIREMGKSAPKGVEVHIPNNNIPINSLAFTRLNERTQFRDPSLSEKKRNEVLRSGLVTLVGASLLYYPFDPYSTTYVMRNRQVWIGETDTKDQLTIPGGHTMAGNLLSHTLAPLRNQIDTGKRNGGHTLLDVSGLRETIEETGLAVEVLQTARPLTIGDQIMRAKGGEPVRYLAHIWSTILWPDTVNQLQDGDGQGKWRIFDPSENGYLSKRGILKLDLTPIARIALNVFHE